MKEISLEELMKKVPNKFKLVLLSAKRARELTAGAPKLIKTNSEKETVIALEEIRQGKIKLEEEKKKG
jgi:DNA-directed RNA polymerase subunit omega